MKLSPPTTRFEAAPPVEATWSEAGPLPPPRRRRRSLLRHPFFWWVIVPTLIVAGYLNGFAADQYVSEARFVVRGRAEASSGGGLGSMLAQSGLGNQSNDTQTVREFMISHDAARRLNERMPLIEVFRKTSDGNWTLFSHRGTEVLLNLESLNIAIPLSQIYADIEFLPDFPDIG